MIGSKPKVAPRGECPSCRKKGLGNVYVASGGGRRREPPRAYRQCRYCSHIAFSDEAKTS